MKCKLEGIERWNERNECFVGKCDGGYLKDPQGENRNRERERERWVERRIREADDEIEEENCMK